MSRGVFVIVLAASACDRVFGIPAPLDATSAVDTTDTTSDASSSAQLLAHYRFDIVDQTVADETGNHPGIPQGSFAVTAGHIGSAYRFAISDPIPHVVVPPSPAWDAVGAIELWIQPVSAQGKTRGIVSRDNVGTTEGNFVLTQVDQFFVVRLQRGDDPEDMVLCSNQTPVANQWTHIGVNFGAPQTELWVDGTLATRSGDTFSLFDFDSTCGARAGQERSIAGNDNPWVFGATTVFSEPGTTSSVTHALAGGALDELKIWGSRRDFTSPARRP